MFAVMFESIVLEKNDGQFVWNSIWIVLLIGILSYAVGFFCSLKIHVLDQPLFQ